QSPYFTEHATLVKQLPPNIIYTNAGDRLRYPLRFNRPKPARNSSTCFSQANFPKHSTHTTLFWYAVGTTVFHTSFGISKSPLSGEPHTLQARGGRTLNRRSPSFI